MVINQASLWRVAVVLSCVLFDECGLLVELLGEFVGVGSVELKVEVEIEKAELPERNLELWMKQSEKAVECFPLCWFSQAFWL